VKAVLFALIAASAAAPALCAPTPPSSTGGSKAPLDALTNKASACNQVAEKAVDTARADALPYMRLDQLPAGHPILAVLRSQNGCPVLEVRYQGRDYFMGPPAKTDQVRPIPLDRMTNPVRK
jgi:hypothetical protein